MTLRVLDGIGAISSDYDAFILDVWGVLHDGSQPFPGVIDALQRLKRAGKRSVVLSNAPRRAAMVASRMAEIGIPRSLYDHVHSSGEEAWLHLKRRDDAFFKALGRRCYFIGPPRDEPVMKGLDLERVARVEDADFLLAIGPTDWEESVAPYEAMLQSARARNLPMVCANADLVVIHQGRRSICAGAIAARYEEIGGNVRWHGKPHESVYETCLRLLDVPDSKRILALGDSLRTDIAGAHAMGLDSVLLASGIHAEEIGLVPGEPPDPARIERLIEAAGGFMPRAVMTEFRW
ncbi:MAG TPA: TIGR01459 family HAD-type hydrolase [Stellaceae bacterium]|nr:TIGR01459 family HAD-type hydrolase [Stellaceae bacterium]